MEIKHKLVSWVPTGDGKTALPRRFEATIPSQDPDEGTVKLTVDVDDWGRPACSRLELTPNSGGAITSAMLRRIPINRLLEAACAHAAMSYEQRPDGTTALSPPSQEAEAEAIVESLEGAARKPRSGSPIDDEHLERVAEEYRRALASGAKRHAPTEAVSLAMHVHRSTASRWIRLARERGYLGPAKRGRAGE